MSEPVRTGAFGCFGQEGCILFLFFISRYHMGLFGPQGFFQAGTDCAGMDAGSGFLASFFCVKMKDMRTGAGNGGI